MNAYLIDNIEYNFARGNYKYAKEDLALLLNEQKKKYALATMCNGGGQGIATILEAI